jgi:hypothetical protein
MFYKEVFFIHYLDIDECALKVCGFHGTCSNTNGSYFCNCTDGFAGQNCDTGRHVV